jgi:predicted AlkP superfamily phosphohydrolase/phosphomutase
MATHGPVVMIGLDGVAWPLLEGWAADGRLPALQGLIEGGVQGRLHTAEGFNDNAVWAAFATARRPERHGWLHYHRIRPGGYELERRHRDHIDGVSFWQQVSDAGRTVTVLDVPKSPLGHGLRGIELTDWLTHGADIPTPVSHPPGLADEVMARHGPHHGSECLSYGRRGEDLAGWIDERLAMTARKGDLTLEQLQAREADLVVVGFSAGHCIGHQCWHVHDPDHVDHEPQEAAQLGDPVLAAYRALDHEVGRIVDTVGEDATVVAFAGLGMGTNYSATGVLDRLLLRTDPRMATGPGPASDRALSLWRRSIPLGIRKAMPRAWHDSAARHAARQRARRSYFPVDTGHRSGGIRLNLVGREEEGVVADTDAEAVGAELETVLHDLVDADTGEPIVAKVERTAQTRSGPYVGDLPDLVVHWTVRRGPPAAVRSSRFGVIPADPPDRTGHHHAHGFFVARGPGLPAGVTAGDAEIVDLGPTVADRLGVELQAVDGRIIPLATSPDPAGSTRE